MMFNDNFNSEYKYGKEWVIEDGQVIFFTENLYNLWVKYANNNKLDYVISRQEFTMQLRRLSFSIKPNTAYVRRYAGKTRRGVFLDMAKMEKMETEGIKAMLDVFIAVARDTRIEQEQEEEIV